MDYNNPVGIEYRVVQETDYNGQPARIVSGARTFDTSPSDLWDALTNPDRLTNWFLPISGDLNLNGRYQLKGHASGEITRCDPPHALDLTWECGGNVSWVSLRLEPDDEGTRLTLAHTMLKDEESEAHWKKYGPGATGVGWDLGFLGLGLFLTSGGVAVDRAECDEWMASDEGKVFIRKCASSWGATHVQSGEDSVVARGMAEHTAKFYCGEQ